MIAEVVINALKSSLNITAQGADIEALKLDEQQGMDSLTRVEVTMAMEQELQQRGLVPATFALPDNYAEGAVTVGDLINALGNHIPAKS